MRLAVAASPEVAIPSLNALLDGKHTLVRVISQPDKPAGRGKILTPTAVSQWADAHGVELAKPNDPTEIFTLIDDVDCVITIGYGVLLPEALLNIPRYGFLNLHFSILPRWRGAAPVQRSIEANDPVTGVTVFRLDAGMDTGPIYTIHRFALDSDITSDELLLELAGVGVGALDEALEMIERGDKPVAQSSTGATRAKKLSREEGRINWNDAADVIHAKIRAFTSNPGAWTVFRGSPIKIASPLFSQHALAPGEIAVIERKVHIGTGSQALEIGLITSAGKSPISAASWANGARLIEGEKCE